MNRLSAYVLLVVLVLLSGCNKHQGPQGDAEAVYGGDSFDIAAGNARAKVISAAKSMLGGQHLEILNEAASDCASNDVCTMIDRLEPAQRARVASYLLRNAARFLALTSALPQIKILPADEKKVTPAGRTVVAWVEKDEAGVASIRMHRSVLELGLELRVALLAHELAHLTEDADLGHAVEDDETIAGFSAPEGDGRFFADSVGALLSHYAFSLAKIEAEEAGPYQVRPFVLGADYPGVWEAGHASFGDFDGDGKFDLLFEHNQQPNDIFAVSRSNGESFDSSSNLFAFGHFTAGKAQYADVNGDGKTDLIFQNGSNLFYLGLSGSGSGFTAPVPVLQHGGTFEQLVARYTDVDGDGRADLNAWAFVNGGIANWVSFSTGTGFTPSVLAITLPGATALSGQVKYADVNGDGKMDVIYHTLENAIYVALSRGRTSFGPLQLVADFEGSYTGNQIKTGDMNGDGLQDILYCAGVTCRAVMSRPQGGFAPPVTAATLPGTMQAHLHQWALPDMNGDGMVDFVFRGSDKKVRIALATAQGFAPLKPYLTIDAETATTGEMRIADIDGDGRKDIVYHDMNNDFWIAYSRGLTP